MDAKCFPLSVVDYALVTITAYGLCSVTERQEKEKKTTVIKSSTVKLSVLHNTSS